jgi:glycosyltransferase involved in cell wall biosynthesis
LTPVAINARAGARRHVGGVERWAAELSARLPALRPGRYRVLRPPPRLAHRAGQAWEQLALPVAARGSRAILSPANLAPLASWRNVVVIHDFAPFRGPEWYGRAYGAWHRALLPRLARRALLVIVPSEFVRDEARELTGIGPEKVRVVPPGVDERFSAAADGHAVAARLGLRGPYLLALGTGSGRKNHALLDRLAPALAGEGIEVVIAGAGRAYMRGDSPGVARRLGYVSEADLPGLYAGAAAVAMPSLYEGFGLPCLEAMACGTPVVAADRAALPEACGGAAILADPADPDAFGAAVLRAAGPERERLVAAGLDRAAAHAWQRTAELTDAAIAELL